MPSGPSLHSIKQVSGADLGSPLYSGGKTLRHQKDSGNTKETFLLAKTSTGCGKVYQVLYYLCYCQTDN
jgi:hypothetical protein